MLSFGMEYDFAFSIAFCSERLPSGSPPPSRAATMIARESLEKSLPRLASAAPFLCLIDDHLLCPDMGLLFDELQEELVDTRVVRELGMEGRDHEPPVPDEHGLAVQLGQHLDALADVAHARRTDEDAVQRLAGELEIGLEARDLAPVGVAVDVDVDQAEVRAVEDDHPGAGAEDRLRELAHRILEPVQAHQPHERRRLAAGDDEPVEPVELLGLTHLDHVRTEAAQHGGVLAHVSL